MTDIMLKAALNAHVGQLLNGDVNPRTMHLKQDLVEIFSKNECTVSCHGSDLPQGKRSMLTLFCYG